MIRSALVALLPPAILLSPVVDAQPGARSLGERLFPGLGNGGYEVQVDGRQAGFRQEQERLDLTPAAPLAKNRLATIEVSYTAGRNQNPSPPATRSGRPGAPRSSDRVDHPSDSRAR
ncbi:hypothetical protein JOF53_001207 [Crossiella equi]|uniref:Uncharacterized protein n=1 Tax=Crossiella equi TaxID=130796 RepID=A0ABS5A6W4_9PSEU|nr:M1 family metallopeptidase [Crossiella equi]MBP2472335.1 hypothetical protein [Crossiella equi]